MPTTGWHSTNYSTDLTDRNCMWGMASLRGLTRSAKYKAFGRPFKKAIPCRDLWKEGELVNEIEVPSDLRTEDFYLADFGLAMKIGDEPKEGFPPELHCSPERLHNQDPSFAC